MGYRNRLNKGSKKFEKMLQARERKRLEGPPPSYAMELPRYRRQLIIRSFDFGEEVEHVIDCYRTPRVDCFRVIVDGQELPNRLGWSSITELARKAFPRVLSTRNL